MRPLRDLGQTSPGGAAPGGSVVPSKTGRTPARPVRLAGNYFSLKSALMADPSSVVSVTV
jgi:hypothetical protein